MAQPIPASSSAAQLPLRSGVGIVLVNDSGLVWVGNRRPRWYPSDSRPIWQMPQGGIDDTESPIDAARRELFEETNVRSVELLAKSANWLTYEVPLHALGVAMKGRYRGQRQRWFAMRFIGTETEIDITGAMNGCKPEFQSWRWAPADEVLATTVTHKRDVYATVFQEFSKVLA